MIWAQSRQTSDDTLKLVDRQNYKYEVSTRLPTLTAEEQHLINNVMMLFVRVFQNSHSKQSPNIVKICMLGSKFCKSLSISII
jgi:hypothetical protein